MDGRLTLAALAVAFLAWAGILIGAWPTWQGIGTGTVAACADAVLHGEAPGLAKGDAFLTTTVLPPVPLVTAMVKSSGISWRAAVRWVNLLAILALAAAVALAAQALGGSGVAITVSLSLLLVSYPFVGASLAGRPEPLAAALSIGALAAWCQDPRRRGWLAPALAAAAWLVSPSAIAVPLAVLISTLTPGARRASGPFTARFVAALAAGFLLTAPWHSPGWYADSLHTLVFSPTHTRDLLRGPFELLRAIAGSAELAVAFGLAMVYLTGEWSRGRPIRPFAAASLAVVMLVLTNRGADQNQLLELMALAAVGAGMWAERATRREAALGTALLLMVVTGAAWRDVSGAWREAHAPEVRRAAVLAAVRGTPGRVLCEDPLLDLAAGRRPEVSDAAEMRSRLGKGDARAAQVVARLIAGRYALVVLDRDLALEREHRYRDAQLGAAAATAIASRYEAAGEADGFHLYRPIPLVSAEPVRP